MAVHVICIVCTCKIYTVHLHVHLCTLYWELACVHMHCTLYTVCVHGHSIIVFVYMYLHVYTCTCSSILVCLDVFTGLSSYILLYFFAHTTTCTCTVYEVYLFHIEGKLPNYTCVILWRYCCNMGTSWSYQPNHIILDGGVLIYTFLTNWDTYMYM